MLSIPGCGRLAVVVVIVCFPIVLYFVRVVDHVTCPIEREGGGDFGESRPTLLLLFLSKIIIGS